MVDNHGAQITNPTVPIPPLKVLLEVWKVQSRKEAVALFIEINRSQSVQEIDLPEELAVHSSTKVTIDGAVAQLRKQFPSMFKPSTDGCIFSCFLFFFYGF